MWVAQKVYNLDKKKKLLKVIFQSISLISFKTYDGLHRNM